MPNRPIWATAHCAVRGQCQPVATHALKTGTLPTPAQLPCRALTSGCQPASSLQSGLVSAQRCWKRILCQPQRTGPGHKHTRVGLGRQVSGGTYPAPSTGRFPPFHSFSTPYTVSDAFPPFFLPFYINCIVTTTHLPIQRHLRFCLQSEAFVGAGNIH